MPVRPSKLWKDLAVETRQLAADAFWRDEDSENIVAQHFEALMAIARRMNFRMKSVQSLPIERRAKQLAMMSDVSDAVATRALIAYHFANQRPLMAAFLDGLGIAHENGLITAEQVPTPTGEQIDATIKALRAAYPDGAVELYLRTLAAMDGDTWAVLESHLPLSD
jgi:hypothetical protein